MKYGDMPRKHEEVIFNKLVAAANGDERVLLKIVQGLIKITLTAVSYLVAKYAQLVNYSLTLKQFTGGYNWVNVEIDEKNFPSTEAGNKDVEFGLFHFNRDLLSEDAIECMEAEGFRPTTAQETLSFGQKQPKLQLKYLIVGLGSAPKINGEQRVVVLGCEDSRRYVYLFNYVRIWHSKFRFLGVRIGKQKAP